MGSLRDFFRKDVELPPRLWDREKLHREIRYLMADRKFIWTSHDLPSNTILVFERDESWDVREIVSVELSEEIDVQFLLVRHDSTAPYCATTITDFVEGHLCRFEGQLRYQVTRKIGYRDFPNFKEKMGKHLVRAWREFKG
jgi:hypothetical protein